MKRIVFALAAVAGLGLVGASAAQAADGFGYGGHSGYTSGYDSHYSPVHSGYTGVGGHYLPPPVHRTVPAPHPNYHYNPGHGYSGGHRGVSINTGHFSLRMGH